VGAGEPVVTLHAVEMNEPGLTAREMRYLEGLRRIPTAVRSRILGWTLELVPSIGFFSYGLFSDRRIFLVLGFLNLLYFALWRMYSQFMGFRLMHSIYRKRLSATEHEDV